MTKDVSQITRRCPSCSKFAPAYLATGSGKAISRADACQFCKSEFPLSLVQSRRVWKSYQLAMSVAGRRANALGIDEAVTEQFAHDCLETCARRYSTLNGAKFATYVYSFITRAVYRWCQPDRKGGINTRLTTNCGTNGNSNGSAIHEGNRSPLKMIASRHGGIGAVDAADVLRKARDGMTDEEWNMVVAWGAGELSKKPEELLVKAQRLIQRGNNERTN